MRLQDGERRGIVAPDECRHLDDAGSARVGDELLRERRADAAALVGVGDLECDLGAGAASARAERSPPAAGRRRRRRRARGAFAPDGREPAQLLLAQPVLEAVEARQPRRARRGVRRWPGRVAVSPCLSGRTRSSGPCFGFTTRVCIPTQTNERSRIFQRQPEPSEAGTRLIARTPGDPRASCDRGDRRDLREVPAKGDHREQRSR